MKPGLCCDQGEPCVALLADLNGFRRAVGAKNDRTLGGRTDPVAGNLGQRGDRLESAVDMAFKGVEFHGSDRILGVDL